MPTRQDYVDGVKLALKTLGVESAMKFLSIYMPGVVHFPVVGWILKKIIDYYWGWAVEQGEFMAFTYFIDFRTSAQGREWEKAVEINRLAQKYGTKEQKDAAVAALKAAHDRLVDLRL